MAKRHTAKHDVAIPFSDPRWGNVIRFGRVSIPTYDKLPATYVGADLIAVRGGVPPTVTYTYYVWSGSLWQAIGIGGGGGTLDYSYDFGGPGSGRVIDATDGPVLIRNIAAPGLGDTTPNLDLRRALADVLLSIVQIGINGEANPRLNITADGKLNFGQDGTAPPNAPVGWGGVGVVELGQGASGGAKARNIYEGGVNTRVGLPDGTLIGSALQLTTSVKAIVANILTVDNPHTLVSATGTVNSISTSGYAAGDDILLVSPNAGGITVTLAHGVGNIVCVPAANIVLDSIGKTALLVRKGLTYYAFALGASSGSGGHTIADEGTALPAQATMDFIGEYVHAFNDAIGAVTEIRAGWKSYDGIVDSDQHTQLDSGTADSQDTGTSTYVDADTGTVNDENGTTTSASVDGLTITDNTKAWANAQWSSASLRMTSGPASGQARAIVNNNATVITVASAFSPPPTAGGGDTYVIESDGNTLVDSTKAWAVNDHVGRVVEITAGTGSGQKMQVINNSATVLSLVAPDWTTIPDNTSQYKLSLNKSTTLNDTTKAWVNNEHVNRFVKITAGRGSGQTRKITANTGTQLTVDTAWTTTPDSSSQYAITASTTTTLKDAAKAWAVDQWKGCRVVQTSGNGIDSVEVIASNTANTLTLVGSWDTVIDHDTTYFIQPSSPIYKTFKQACNAGHVSLLFRKSTGETDFTITASHAVAYVLGANSAVSLAANITVDREVLFDNVGFSGTLTLNVTGSACVGCRFSGNTAALHLNGTATAAIVCSFISAGGANGAVHIEGVSCRVQACSFTGGTATNLIVATASATRAILTGNACLNTAFANQWTGYFFDGSASLLALISGNFVIVPTTATGGMKMGAASNASGNFVQADAFSSGTRTLIEASTRCVLTGNTLSTVNSTVSGTAVLQMIKLTAANNLISGNCFVWQGSVVGSGWTIAGVRIEAGQAMQIITGNAFIHLLGSTTATYYAVDPADAPATEFVFSNNQLVSNTASNSPLPIKVSSRIWTHTVLRDVLPYLPPLKEFRYEGEEDWETSTAIDVRWETFGTGGTPSVAFAAQAGQLSLSTGAVANNDVGARFKKNIVRNYDGTKYLQMYTECVFNLNSVADVRMRAGLGDYAGWVTNMARPTDGLFVELDTAVSGNFVVIGKTGAASQSITVGAASTGWHRFVLFTTKSGHLMAFFDGVFFGTWSATGMNIQNLICPGMFVRALAAADKILLGDMMAWGCLRDPLQAA